MKLFVGRTAQPIRSKGVAIKRSFANLCMAICSSLAVMPFAVAVGEVLREKMLLRGEAVKAESVGVLGPLKDCIGTLAKGPVVSCSRASAGVSVFSANTRICSGYTHACGDEG